MNPISPGSYTSEQIKGFGLNPDETTSTQTIGGLTYKLEDNKQGGRIVSVVGGSSTASAGNYSGQLQSYLDDYNTAKANEKQAMDQFFKTPEQMKAEFDTYVKPAGGVPEVPKLVDLYQTLRSDNNLTELEQNLNALKAQENELKAQLRASNEDVEGKPTALNVIQGRMSEQTRLAQKQLDFLNVQKQTIIDELNTRYSAINTIITLTGQDYNNAITAYNTQFTQNLELYKIIRGTQEKQLDISVAKAGEAKSALQRMEIQIENWKREDKIRAEDAARSNLQIYATAIKSGNMDYGSLSSETKLQIQKLEVQSGLGVGFLSSLQRDNPNGEIKSITTRQDASGMKYADVIMVNPDGSLKVESKPLGMERLPEGSGGSGGLSATQTRTYVSSALKILGDVDLKYQTIGGKLEEIDGGRADKRLSSAEANLALDKIIQAVGSRTLGEQIFIQAWNEGNYQKWGK